VELLLFKTFINLTPSQFLISVSCPTQGFPYNLFKKVDRKGSLHTTTLMNSMLNNHIFFIHIQLEALCKLKYKRSNLLNLTTIDQKLNLLREVYTTKNIICCLGNVVQKGRLEVMNIK
jgi:hypothetical protein